MSSTSTWGSPDPQSDEICPTSLLRRHLKQMIAQFSAQGGCIALLDENSGQMRVQVHLRRHILVDRMHSPPSQPLSLPSRNAPASLRPSVRKRMYAQGQSPASDCEDVIGGESSLFAIDTCYPIGQDIIGYTWQTNAVAVLYHEDCVKRFHNYALPSNGDIVPAVYLAIPVREFTALDHAYGRQHAAGVLGVIVLYQEEGWPAPPFHSSLEEDALQSTERLALILQNDRLQRSKKRSNEFLQLLQEIGTAFPTTVMLSDLVENMYRFAVRVVDVSSMMLTLYDRDTERIYDVFAVCNGTRIDGLAEQPIVALKEERPVWWQVTQDEKRKVQFSPARDFTEAARYEELLVGAWGDQRQAESFLLLPMKMFNRVIGSLCLTSRHGAAYRTEEILVLETMVQIVTVSIENAKLYERDRQLLNEARQREAQLAAINSALQSINSVLNASELLNSFVESVATLVNVEISVFFQLSPNDDQELVAQAMYGQSSVSLLDDGSELPALTPPRNDQEHEELVKLIRLPFKDTILEQMIHEGFFYLDASNMEELAQRSEHGGKIFLAEITSQQMLMIPMHYQAEFIGILAVPLPKDGRFLRPKEIGMLLAICAQATNAIRNAQLFEQREEAYAELQRMDKLKDEFLVTASHELRTPLSGIIGYASLLRRQSARISPQQVLRFATKIGGAAQQMHDLVENMTVAAKMGALDKNLELHISPVQVFSAAEIAANMLTPNIEQKFHLSVDPSLWVKGDAVHFRQVLTNLLDNAAKYSPPQSRIEVSAQSMTLAQVAQILPTDQIDHELLVTNGQQPVVLIRVQDQGEGIQSEDQRKIFEKFVRAPRSLTTPVRGSGLGLYICRRSIEAMQGRLWLERSTPNEGSVFSFYLPQEDQPMQTGEHITGEHEPVQDISSR